jgi:hypothetical protein
MIFAIDFDGTIVEHAFPAIGKEYEGAIRTMKLLQRDGHEIILWTCRDREHGLGEALDFLKDRGFVPDAVNSNAPSAQFGDPKVYADVYVDDRSFPPFDPTQGWEVLAKMYYLSKVEDLKI